MNAERDRLSRDEQRKENWKRWGPYLSERQWGTVREDYSADGSCWSYFPHDHARSRAYRWGEDGLLGITDRECRLCFALSLWNETDSILKERLFGLTGPEGNHGEDVKEEYFYLESLPTHSYMKALYKYPQAAFPYGKLLDESRRRTRADREYELFDSGLFNEQRYFDVFIEYAKADPNDILVRLRVVNRGPTAAPIHVLPTLWFRNTWSWGRSGEGYTSRPRITQAAAFAALTRHETLEPFIFEADSANGPTELIFTENETNVEKLFGSSLDCPYVKDSFNEYVINKRRECINPAREGTKAAFRYQALIPAGGHQELRFRFYAAKQPRAFSFSSDFDKIFSERKIETDIFYEGLFKPELTPAERNVARQAYAGLMWTKQFYYYSIREWLEGDPTQPPPADNRRRIRNTDWAHLYNRDIISMPDKWEYPWYAAWDLGFHMIPMAKIDPDFAKQQLILFLREWFMHPNGQLPAYEFALSDVNPPVHPWACWRVYKLTAPKGKRDKVFLARVFQKLLINFTWWVNRKDPRGNNLFAGGFLGLDNIGVFDRSQPLPIGEHLEQADGTAWMAFYCATMLSIATELASTSPEYEDLASKFFEHFVAITDAMNAFGGSGLWDDVDGFYYDQLHIDGKAMPLRVRSIVGLIPLLAVEVLENEVIDRLPAFKKRMKWFLNKRADLARNISYMEHLGVDTDGHRLLAVPSRARLTRILRYLLDENEFLSPFGIRSLSKIHAENPYLLNTETQTFRVDYDPGESRTTMFGGNSNWRGPVWFPINYLIIEALEKYHYYYGDTFVIECPTGSGKFLTLGQVANEIARRLGSLFCKTNDTPPPALCAHPLFGNDPFYKDLLNFHEFFNADTGEGLGANHQTGWTALITRCLDKVAQSRSSR